MKLLEERIKKDGKALGKTVLKVDSFINHQVDSEFMESLGKDFAEHFKDYGITKVFTIESSGIAPALMAAKYLDVPMVILKKQTSKILNGKVYQTRVTSFTKGTSYELTLYQDYINPSDKVLLIDDFLANGEAASFREKTGFFPKITFRCKSSSQSLNRKTDGHGTVSGVKEYRWLHRIFFK